MKRMIGIADAHGIESYKEYGDGTGHFTLYIRAESNRQRHAVVYVVEMSEKADAHVQEQIKKKDWKKALEVIKKEALTIGFPKDRAELYRKSWDLIPNPKLDPWR